MEELPTHLMVCFIIMALHTVCTIRLNYLIKKEKIDKQFHTPADVFWVLLIIPYAGIITTLLFLFLTTKNFIEQN